MRVVAALLCTVCFNAFAAWPEKPIKIVLPFGAGGVADVTSRILAEKLSQKLGQRVVIENMPGPGGINAARAVISAAPDGYTMCGVSIEVMSIYPHIEPQLYARWASLHPVTLIARNAGVMLAHPSVPADDLAGFVRWAKGRNDLNYGSSGEGSAANLLYEWLKGREGLRIEHVPYRGIVEAFNETAAGRVQVS